MDPSNRPDSTDQGRSNGAWPKEEDTGGKHRGPYGYMGNLSATSGQQMTLDPIYGDYEDYAMDPAQHQPNNSTAAFGHHDQLFSAAADKNQGGYYKTPKNATGNPYLQNQSMITANQPPQVRNAIGNPYQQNQPVDASNQPPQVRTPLSEPYLQSQPEYVYNMPGGTLLNFTLVEVIALMVNWFKVYPDLAERFLNNGLTSGTHMVILEEHRNISMLDRDRNRTKDLISDGYRRSMRRIHESWTKAKHKKPQGWDGNVLSVNHLSHDKAGKATPIPMKVLMNGIKHLPQGDDAGDLTRALQYAISNQKRGHNAEVLDWMFPDDLHTILAHIGYTAINQNHLDEAAVARYDTVCKHKEQLDRKRRRESQEQKELLDRKRRREALEDAAQGKGMSPPPSKRQLCGERAGDNELSQAMPPPAIPGSAFQPSAQGAMSTLLSTVPAPPGFVFQSASRIVGPERGPRIPQPLSRDAVYGPIDPALQGNNAVREKDARPNAAFTHQAGRAAVPSVGMSYASPFAVKKPNSVQDNHQRPNGGLARQADQTAMQAPSMPYGPSFSAKQPTSVQEKDTQNAVFAHQANKAAIPALSMPSGLRPATNETNSDLSNASKKSTPMTPPPNIISMQPPAAGDSVTLPQEDVDISPEEIDAIIAGNQIPNFNDLLEGPFYDFRPDSLAETEQEYSTAYPPDKLLSECAEADDLEDDSALAQAARWCRDPRNFAGRHTVGELAFVITLRRLVEDASDNGFDGFA